MSAAPGSQRPAGVRGLLGTPLFRRLYTVRLVSQGSDGVFQASLAASVLFNPDHSTDAAKVAVGFAVLLLPYSLVGPFAGVLLDRWRRQRVLVVANVVRTGLVVLSAAALLVHGPSGPVFAGLALAVISVNRFYLSALSAALPHTVEPARLVPANALSTTSGTAATAVGAGIAVAARAVAGSGDHGDAVVALLAGAGYLLSSALAARIRPAGVLGPSADPQRLPAAAALRTVVADLRAGARHVRERPQAATALAAIGAHRFFYGVSTLATLLLYRNYFTDSGWLRAGLAGLAEVVVASGVGSLLAAVLTPRVTRRIGKPAWVVVVFAAAAVVEVVLGLPYTKGPLLVAAFILGVASQGSKICVDTIVQESVDDAFRGRVFSFYDTLFNLTFVSAAVVAALTLPRTGKSYPVLALIACGYALTALLYGLAARRHVAAVTTAAV